ncbi:hypothetical protein [Methylobacterium oxalidis]|uniref:CARDB domain-containing protein n=1 Tax=Methylobacterium oxalidis TaxID=944322 RepID=A0A512JDD7_9HYPH|nr:hypothetical protein [Methylobacterium oxalidis]GEP07969.1 hypothetical protein MOX02_60070 [Methylobacterium oxalidis]GJE35634.1 hypothetical protein LDDCCGHA_5854 [Methylobacterium oxalidis]GLS64645.1 hypothetical protein GCM10007888_30260 [Methylobacterium oxalidis]
MKDVTALILHLVLQGLFIAGAGPAEANGPVIIREVALVQPSDSHAPQKALVDVQNTGSNPVRDVALTCTFSHDGGVDLETREASIAEIARHATVRSEVIYYGWPKARRVSCELITPR